MASLSDWRNAGQSPVDESRFADHAWRLIQRKPDSIIIRRGATVLAAQTVAVEMSNAQVEREGQGDSLIALRDAVVFGIRNHATLPDTDIKRDDLFEHDGQDYRVMDLVLTMGGIQAHCEVIA